MVRRNFVIGTLSIVVKFALCRETQVMQMEHEASVCRAWDNYYHAAQGGGCRGGGTEKPYGT